MEGSAAPHSHAAGLMAQEDIAALAPEDRDRVVWPHLFWHTDEVDFNVGDSMQYRISARG